MSQIGPLGKESSDSCIEILFDSSELLSIAVSSGVPDLKRHQQQMVSAKSQWNLGMMQHGRYEKVPTLEDVFEYLK